MERGKGSFSALMHLRNPNQLRIIRSPRARREVPIINVPESRRVPIQKGKVRAPAVQVRVNVVLLSHCRQFSIVKQPYHSRRLSYRGKLHLVTGAASVYVLIQAIVKQVIPIAAAGVRGADPERLARVNSGVRPPRHFVIRRNF